jgi:hypothetical protein
MTTTLLRSVTLSVLTITALFVLGALFPTLIPVIDIFLLPGYFIPEAYWGGVHDPVQILTANLLNVIFYGAAYFAVFSHLKKPMG